mgnify:CR=1 FL=1
MVKVAFICVHNSCRSQIAEALGKSWRGMCFIAFRRVPKQSRKSTPMPCG